MSPEYPYQLVSFLDKEPVISEGVYQGENGWYPQIALKRRFRSMDEASLLSIITEFTSSQAALKLKTGQLVKPEKMPVRVIEILNSSDIKQFHLDFIDYMGSSIESQYPERDENNYLPHITAEYGDKLVINVDTFILKSFNVDRVCLIKDGDDMDSHVVAYFNLKNPNKKF